MKNNFAIVLPAYNEGKTIKTIVKKCLLHCDNIIVIDDCSTDNTIKEVEGLNISLIKHTKNLGKGASLWGGFQFAIKEDIEFIITLDGDGQHPTDYIPNLIQEYQKNSNYIIIGSRLADKTLIPKKRYYANKIANFWISWACGYRITDSQSGFRLYPVNLFQDLIISPPNKQGFVFESSIMIEASKRKIYSLPVKIPAIYNKDARPSHFQGVRDISLITLMVAKSLMSRFMYLQGLYKIIRNK